jgi:catechol-2,3-dioxygenase
MQLNISFAQLSFYKELFDFLGWSIIFETSDTIGFKNNQSGDLWFVNNSSNDNQDFDKKGLNHIAIRVEKENDVHEVEKFLQEKNISSLFGTPRHRPEFTSQPNHIYYQIMFASPDNILFEVVYIGEKR